jgi:hypothetical protein
MSRKDISTVFVYRSGNVICTECLAFQVGRVCKVTKKTELFMLQFWFHVFLHNSFRVLSREATTNSHNRTQFY